RDRGCIARLCCRPSQKSESLRRAAETNVPFFASSEHRNQSRHNAAPKITGLKPATTKPLRGNGTPFYRDPLDAVERIFQKIASAHQRETQVVFPFRAKGRSGNGGDAGFFEQDLLHFFGGESGVFDLNPSIQSAFGP